MKKRVFIALVLAAAGALAACEAAPEDRTESADSESEEETQKMAFGKALWEIYQQGILPDGSILDYTNTESAAGNSFAIIDIDNDGRDELLLLWENTVAVAGMTEFVFGWDDGVIHTELAEFPSQTFYDNGIVEAEWSHNQGLAGEFWPYNVYRYEAESDTYRFFGGADAWDKSFREEDYEGNPFPTDLDTDGDGLVYYILPAGWNGQYDDISPVDGADYERWRNAYIDGAEEIKISFQKLTEENIAALGYPKPDITIPQPAG